jgi:hypothetical protein
MSSVVENTTVSDVAQANQTGIGTWSIMSMGHLIKPTCIYKQKRQVSRRRAFMGRTLDQE